MNNKKGNCFYQLLVFVFLKRQYTNDTAPLTNLNLFCNYPNSIVTYLNNSSIWEKELKAK